MPDRKPLGYVRILVTAKALKDPKVAKATKALVKLLTTEEA